MSADAFMIPSVSVVIPTYNRSALLRRSISSVLNQTFEDIEVIVVDDGSTDDTKSVVYSFNDQRIRYLMNRAKKGASGARNTGIMAARAELIAFQDSDDEWLPDKLEKQLRLMRNAEIKTGIVYSGFNYMEGAKATYFPSAGVNKRSGDLHVELLKGNFIAIQVALIRKQCFQTSGMFDENLPCRHDWELWIRISKDWQFAFIDEPLVLVYCTPVSITTTQKYAITGWKPVIEKHLDTFRKHRKILARNYLYISSAYNLSNPDELTEAKKLVFKALAACPLVPRRYWRRVLMSLFGPAFYHSVRNLFNWKRK